MRLDIHVRVRTMLRETVNRAVLAAHMRDPAAQNPCVILAMYQRR
jgi:hypothetical protein